MTLLERMKAVIGRAQEGTPLRTDLELFGDGGLESLEESVIDATGVRLHAGALIDVFQQLPPDLQQSARRFGLHDQVVADEIFGWLEANADRIPEIATQLAMTRDAA